MASSSSATVSTTSFHLQWTDGGAESSLSFTRLGEYFSFRIVSFSSQLHHITLVWSLGTTGHCTEASVADATGGEFVGVAHVFDHGLWASSTALFGRLFGIIGSDACAHGVFCADESGSIPAIFSRTNTRQHDGEYGIVRSDGLEFRCITLSHGIAGKLGRTFGSFGWFAVWLFVL